MGFGHHFRDHQRFLDDRGHRHRVELSADGVGRTDNVQGHFHEITADGTAGGATRYRVGEPEGILEARKPLRGSLSFIDRHEVGRIMSRVTSDVTALQELLTTGSLTVLSDVMVLFVVIALLLERDVELALVTFASVPILVGVMVVLLYSSYI